MAAILPLLFAKGNWYTTRFIAARLGVSHRTVQYWVSSGLLVKRGYVIANTIDKGGKRCWVHIPALSRDAMLRKCALDFLPLQEHSKQDERTLTGSGVTPLRQGPG